MAASFQSLPPPVLIWVLSYVADPETVCRFEATCKDFRAVVQNNDTLVWTRLHNKRWTVAPSQEGVLTKVEYGRRHKLDASAIKWIGRLQDLQTSNNKPPNRLVMLYAVSHILACGKYVMDACWKVWRTAASNNQKDDDESSQELLAKDLVHLLHCCGVCEDLLRLLDDRNLTTQQAVSDADQHLEECAILTSKIFFQLDNEDVRDDTKSQWIRKEFDRIANAIKDNGFDAQAMDMDQQVRAVHEVFFNNNEEEDGGGGGGFGFTGNMENYYECDNSLLHVSLERRKAIPMTLAIIYKCVCRRLGIKVDIIGLPGHIVVGVRGFDQYVDVFHGGRFLSQQDCEVIVNMYGFAMEESYLQPLPTPLVVRRVLRNIENCLEREDQVGRSNVMKRAYLTTLKALGSGGENNSTQKLETCRRQLGLTWVTEHLERHPLEDRNLS